MSCQVARLFPRLNDDRKPVTGFHAPKRAISLSSAAGGFSVMDESSFTRFSSALGRSGGEAMSTAGDPARPASLFQRKPVSFSTVFTQGV